MSVSSPTGSTDTSTIGGVSTTAAAAGATSSLNEGDFLDLMMDQLQNQDPLNPADPTQYMSELASFSSLDEEMQIQQSDSQTAANQSASSALQMLGQTVSYTDSNGDTQTGTVSSVDFTSSGPTLTIGGISGIDLSQVIGATATSSTSSTDSSSQSS